MMKFLYNLFTDPLGLPIAPIWEYLIILAISEIVHEIAFSFSPGGKLGSLIYWVTKLVAFVVIWGIIYAIILGIQFIVANWLWFLLGGLAILTIVVVVWILVRANKH